jgi:hypothetical protein
MYNTSYADWRVRNTYFNYVVNTHAENNVEITQEDAMTLANDWFRRYIMEISVIRQMQEEEEWFAEEW